MRNLPKTTRLWMLAVLGVSALGTACAVESVNPQPLPPEDEGTGSETGGKGPSVDNGEQDSPSSVSADAGSASGADGGDSGESDAGAPADATNEGDGG